MSHDMKGIDEAVVELPNQEAKLLFVKRERVVGGIQSAIVMVSCRDGEDDD